MYEHSDHFEVGWLQDRRESLENLARDLTSRVERLSAQAADPSASGGGTEGDRGVKVVVDRELGHEKQEMEEAVRDIESFADQNMAVNQVRMAGKVVHLCPLSSSLQSSTRCVCLTFSMHAHVHTHINAELAIMHGRIRSYDAEYDAV